MKKLFSSKSLSILVILPILLLFQNMDFLRIRSLLPEIPIRMVDTRTVQMKDGKLQTTNPHIPLHDLSLDGRIGSLHRLYGGNVPVFVVKPENVINHITDSQNSFVGANLLDYNPIDLTSNYYLFNIQNFKKAFPDLLNDNFNIERTIFCEKTDIRQNPYVCGSAGDKDCYDITMIGRFGNIPEGVAVLTSVDVRFVVSNPKTPKAYISSVEIFDHTYSRGPLLPFSKLAEPVVVGDNRLLIARAHDETVYTTEGIGVPNTNIVYGVYPARDRNGHPTLQCDVTKWRYSDTNPSQNTVHPIAHAHYDTRNNMKGRYKFARYKMRDGIGNVIPGNSDIGGSYPWMDREATNLFFTAFGGERNFYNFTTNTPHAPLRPYLEKVKSTDYFVPWTTTERGAVEISDARTLGISMVGFWTHGKTILLDGLTNNADFNFRIAGRASDMGRINVHRQLELYKSVDSTAPYYEPVGAVRERGNDVNKDIYHEYLSLNSTYLSSIENRLNYVEAMKPVTPRDVSWHFGSSRHTEEVVFDDYMIPYFLIYADMTATVGSLDTSAKSMRYFDGIENGQFVNSPVSGFPTNPSGTPLLFQNGATAPSDFMRVPSYGKPIGPVRVEPIAKGGMFGKGVWLSASSGIQFSVPEQSSTSFNLFQAPLYFGVFVDIRDNYATNQVVAKKILLSVSGSNETIELERPQNTPSDVSYDRIVLKRNGVYLGAFFLPNYFRLKYKKWYHIGIQFSRVALPELYLNGFKAGDLSLASGRSASEVQPFLSLAPNRLITLGSNTAASPAGVQGWYDELRILASHSTAEEKCNFARGTLGKVVNNQSWSTVASRYPASAHQAIAQITRDSEAKYVCYTRYGDVFYSELNGMNFFAHLKNIPPGLTSVRDDVLLRKRVLKFNEPRPDYTQNRFCLSCHVPYREGATFAETDVRALAFKAGLFAQNDLRRQPQQPPRWLRGVIPANYFGAGKPAQRLNQSEVRYEVDQWVLEATGLSSVATSEKCERVGFNWSGNYYEQACGCSSTHGYYRVNSLGSLGQSCVHTWVSGARESSCEKTTFTYNGTVYDMQCGCSNLGSDFYRASGDSGTQGQACYHRAVGAAGSNYWRQEFERDGYKMEMVCGTDKLGAGFRPIGHRRNGHSCHYRVMRPNGVH